MDAHVQGWLVSLVLHGTVALAAVLFVKQIQLEPQNEPFKWNVAMVSPTPPVQPTASPPFPAPVSAIPDTTSVPNSPVQHSNQTQTPPSPQRAQETTTSISERPTTSMLAEPPPPTPPPPTVPSQPAAQATQSADPSGLESAEPKTASMETGFQKAPSSAPFAVPEQTSQSDAVPIPKEMAAVSSTQLTAPTKRDYGWLSETILRRVEELKRYPAAARADRAEGKVVVKAVINEDGTIGEVEVLQSSGHPGLDKAAVETIQQAAPFHLPHPLGQPHKTIKIPMSYRLDR